MATNDESGNGGKLAAAEQIIDKFLDAIWMERGLSKNTLGAYRADLMSLAKWLQQQDVAVERADKDHLLGFINWRVEEGAKPRSTARQLSSFRRFFRYLTSEAVREDDPTVDIAMPRIGRSLPKTLTEDE
ncbi:MAG: site-specific integrase, partial [Pseudomonadota bacterium]